MYKYFYKEHVICMIRKKLKDKRFKLDLKLNHSSKTLD